MESALVSSYSIQHSSTVLINVHVYMYIGEKPEEEGQSNDELDSGSIIGIIIACVVAALLMLFLIIVSVIAVLHERKKRMGKANLKSTNPNLLDQ